MPGSSGFRMFASIPTGVPQQVAPNTDIMHEDHLQQLRCPMMQEVMDSQNLGPCVAWNHMGAKNGGAVPMEHLENVVPAGQWGRLCEVGAIAGKRGQIRTLEKIFGGTTRATMFQLPVGLKGEHLAAVRNDYHYSGDVAIMEGRPLPYVRYGTVQANQSPVYNHPNNVAHREQNPPQPGSSRRKRRRALPDGQAHVGEEEAKVMDGDDNAEEEKAVDEAGAAEDDDGDVAEDGPREEWLNHAGQDYFELDFAECKVGMHYVAKNVFSDGVTGLTIGKVLEIVNVESKVFEAKMYQCTKPCSREACIGAQWNLTTRKEQVHNYEVIMYFGNFKGKTKRLGKKVQAALHEREDIEWTEVAME